VADAGAEVADGIDATGDQVAQETRSASRRAANRTVLRSTSRTPAARGAADKPAARPTGPTGVDGPSADS
jgi:heparin binding hemagglutinin HbhA